MTNKLQKSRKHSKTFHTHKYIYFRVDTTVFPIIIPNTSTNFAGQVNYFFLFFLLQGAFTVASIGDTAVSNPATVRLLLVPLLYLYCSCWNGRFGGTAATCMAAVGTAATCLAASCTAAATGTYVLLKKSCKHGCCRQSCYMSGFCVLLPYLLSSPLFLPSSLVVRALSATPLSRRSWKRGSAAAGLPLKPNSWTQNFVEVFGHNLESSQTWCCHIQSLHDKHFWSRGRGSKIRM